MHTHIQKSKSTAENLLDQKVPFIEKLEMKKRKKFKQKKIEVNQIKFEVE